MLTASTAAEYSFEGEPADAAVPAGSVFTAALVQSLRTGAADTDRDGYVSVDDVYAYVFDQVQAAGAAQTPQCWLYGPKGKSSLPGALPGPRLSPRHRLRSAHSLHDLRKRNRASAIQVGQAIGMLLEAGPEAGRPLAGRVHHTRLSNLKELRPEVPKTDTA